MKTLNEFLLQYTFFSPVMIALTSLLYLSRADKFTFNWFDLIIMNLAGLGLLFIMAIITGVFVNSGKK